WARRRQVSLRDFLRTPMVLRDPSSNARWTVDGVLRERGLTAASALCEIGTPEAAKREARARKVPVLLSRHVIHSRDFAIVQVDGLSFPRSYVLVLPAYGEPTQAVNALIERLRERADELRSGGSDEDSGRAAAP
ncbi:MAG TPA: LysR substrate-binding domain-containing protein, partial [Thermoleophilaceae bacterium]|nr:LysR substrate-binding domain-containing protein [Thermoleophilaceae bacterium]